LKNRTKTTTLLLLFTLFSVTTFGQESTWKKNVINEILTLNLPSKAEQTKASFVIAFGGELNSNFYGFQYYDTIFQPIENEKQFQISLLGFISAKVSDTTLKKYNVTVVDTSINSTSGLMAKFTTTDTTKFYKEIYYFVTLANSRYYWFFAYSPFSKENDEAIQLFFQSIAFNSEQLREKSFKLTPVHLQKNAN